MKKSRKTKGMVLTFAMAAFFMAGNSSHAMEDAYRLPSLSGATETWVYQGESVDSSLGKVFADDLEDGDLTSLIQADQAVDTQTPGTYPVTYTVKDSDGHQVSMKTTVRVLSTGDSNAENKKIQRTLYTLPDASYLTDISFNRGYYHDRQSLGIWLPAGVQMEVRLVNGQAFGKDLQIDFMNQDINTESDACIPASGEWVTVGNTYTVTESGEQQSRDSVPFIVTPKNTTVQPVIEYRWNDDFQKIPYYRYKGNQQKFFDEWKATNAPYAIIEGSAATFLVPQKDREQILNSSYASREEYRFRTIDEMLDWYAAFVKQYDEYVGLDFHAAEPYNQNIRSKFFIKANEHGWGQAYYTQDHSAYNGDSLDKYLTRDWLSLHEFAHGYEGGLAYQENPFVETTNNILAYYFESTYRPKDDFGWLLGGKGSTLEACQAQLEQRALERRAETSSFAGIVSDPWHYDVSLYMFTNILDKLGPKDAVAAMHTKYRKDAYLTGKSDSSSDVLAESFGDVSGYNVIPYLESYHIYPSGNLMSRIYQKDQPMLYYLKDILPEHAAEVQKQLGLAGVYSLVSTEELKDSGYSSQVTLKIAIDDLAQIQNRNILIKNGREVVKKVPVTDSAIEITLPAGIYEIELPVPRTPAYDYRDGYLVAAEGSVQQEVRYEHRTGNILADDMQIQFRGMSDKLFATVEADSENGKLNLHVEKTVPHSYIGENYAGIRVLDPQGQELYSQNMQGDVELEELDRSFPFPEGSKLEIYHREGSSRLAVVSQYSKNRLEGYGPANDGEITVYTMTAKGLMKESWKEEERNQAYRKALDGYSQVLLETMTQEDLSDPGRFHREKLLIQNACQVLEDAEKENYQKQWGILLGMEPESYQGYERIDSKTLKGMADSENTMENQVAQKALDGDETTIWHSNYTQQDQMPNLAENKNNRFTILLEKPTDVGKLEYVPRAGGGNGVILGYEIWYSTTEDADDFVKAQVSGNVWGNDAGKKSVLFDAKGARRIQIRVTESGGSAANKFLSAAEFYLYETYEIPSSTGKIYLSGLHQKQDAGQAEVGKDVNGNGQTISLMVNGGVRSFSKGIGMLTNTAASWELTGKGYDSILLYAGVESTEDASKEAVVEIYGDGKLLYQTETLKSSEWAEAVSVEVRNVRNLEIRAKGSEHTAVSLGDARMLLAENQSELTLHSGEKSGFLKNTQTISGTESKMVWESSDQEVAVVNEAGIITAGKEGTAVVKAKSSAGEISCTVHVLPEENTGNGETPEIQQPGMGGDQTGATEPEKPETKAPETKAPETKVPETKAPSRVRLTKAKASVKKATVYWKKTAQVQGYEIWMRQGKKKFKRVKTVSAKKTNVKIKKLVSGKKYSFKVRAYRKDAKNKKVYGAFSRIKKVKIR